MKNGSIDSQDKLDDKRLDKILLWTLWGLFLGFLILLVTVEPFVYVIVPVWLYVGVKLKEKA